MSYVLAGVCAMNLLTFARAMPRFAAPDGWPARMRWLSLCGMACACVGIAAAVTAAAPPMRALVGVALAMASHALFRWAIDVALRHRFAIAFADAHPSELTTEGPYRWLAHPLYVSYAATWWALAVGSMHWAPTAGALLMSAFYVSAALGENRTLRALHSPAGKSVQVEEVQMGIESTNGRRPANKRDAWWESLVRPATSRLDLEAAFALRYRVYVDECRKPYPGADHQRRLLSDAWDAHSCVLIAERDGHVAGTIRGTLGREPGFAEAHGRVFAHLDEVRSVGWHRVAYGSRLVVDADVRGHSRLAVALMVAIYVWALRNGATLCLCHTVEPLLPLMEKMGWRRRGEPFLDGDSATQQYPMVLPVQDQGYLQCVGSPLVERDSTPDRFRLAQPQWPRPWRR